MKRVILLLFFIVCSFWANAQGCDPFKPFANTFDTLFLNTGYGWQSNQLYIPTTFSPDIYTYDSSDFIIDDTAWKVSNYFIYDYQGLYITFSSENINDTAFNLTVPPNIFEGDCYNQNSLADTLHVVIVPPVLTAGFTFINNGSWVYVTDKSVIADSVYYVLKDNTVSITNSYTSRNPNIPVLIDHSYQLCQVAFDAKGDSVTYCEDFFSYGYITGPEQDCPGALQICDSIYTQLNSYGGFGKNHRELPATTCLLNNENNSVWYTFVTGKPGYLQFMITPENGSDDYDFALYDITGHTCADIATGVAPEVRCNYTLNDTVNGGNGITTGIGYGGSGTSSGAPGPSFNAALAIDSTPHTFALLVNNFHSGGAGYTLNFSGSTAKIGSDSVLITFAKHNDTVCGGNNTLAIALSRPVLQTSISTSALQLIGPAGLAITSVMPADTFSELTDLVQVTFNEPLPENSDFNIILQPNTLAFLCGKTSVITDTLHLHTTINGNSTAFTFSISTDTLNIINQSGLPNVYYTLADQNGDYLTRYDTANYFVFRVNDYYSLCQYVADTPTCATPLCKTINYNIPVGSYHYFYNGDTLFVNDSSQYGDSVYYYLVDSGAGKRDLTPTYYYNRNPRIILPGSGNYQLCQVIINMVATDTTCKEFTFDAEGIKSPNPENNLLIYPNPTTGMVHVQLPPGNSISYLQLYNTLGMLVLQQETNAGISTTDINLSNLPSATYLLKVMQGGQQMVRRVIKY